MKQAKLIELGQMLEAWRHLVLPHGRTRKLKRANDGSYPSRTNRSSVLPPASGRPGKAGRTAA